MTMNRLVNICIIAIVLCGSALRATPTQIAYAQPAATGEICYFLTYWQGNPPLTIELNPGGRLEVTGLGSRQLLLFSSDGHGLGLDKISGDMTLSWGVRPQMEIGISMVPPLTLDPIDIKGYSDLWYTAPNDNGGAGWVDCRMSRSKPMRIASWRSPA